MWLSNEWTAYLYNCSVLKKTCQKPWENASEGV